MSLSGRLIAEDGVLWIIDLQERLLAAMSDRSRELVLANSVRLVQAAEILDISVRATEQYPQGLGHSVPEIANRIANRHAKTSFHCVETGDFKASLQQNKIRHVTLAGIETHVCVAQTALELLKLGYIVQIAADAVTARRSIDHEFALRRLEQAGAVVSTTEAILFEWTERADRPEFKAISQLIKTFDDRILEGTSS